MRARPPAARIFSSSPHPFFPHTFSEKKEKISETFPLFHRLISVYAIDIAVFTERNEKMKHAKFSRILIILMIIVLLLPAGGAYASSDDEPVTVQPQTVGSYALSFSTSNNVIGNVHVYARSSGEADYITSKITLQSAPLGSSSYTNVIGVSPSTFTVYDSPNIDHLCSFPVSSSKNYRIKIELTDSVNGKVATTTLYKKLTHR